MIYGDRSFPEAIEFFRGKLRIPSLAWDEIWKEAHDHAFIIAGAIKDNLLKDLQESVDQAITEGISIQEFQRQFQSIVTKHGWDYRGSIGWRSHTIYETNLRQAYNAGRWQQMQQVKKDRPYWLYKHGDSSQPRKQHLSWHGTVLPADDPWWHTHSPQNGWGCKCRIFALSQRDVERMGLQVQSKAPDDGIYDWVDEKTGEIHQIPVGIDPGFDYAPGKTKPSQHLRKLLGD